MKRGGVSFSSAKSGEDFFGGWVTAQIPLPVLYNNVQRTSALQIERALHEPAYPPPTNPPPPPPPKSAKKSQQIGEQIGAPIFRQNRLPVPRTHLPYGCSIVAVMWKRKISLNFRKKKFRLLVSTCSLSTCVAVHSGGLVVYA